MLEHIDRHLHWYLAATLLAVLLLIFFAYKGSRDKATAACEARGGVLVETREKFWCLDPKAFK